MNSQGIEDAIGRLWRRAAAVLACLLGIPAVAPAQDDDKAPPVFFRMVCLRHVPDKTELHLAPAHVKGLSDRKKSGEPEKVRAAKGALTLPQNNLSPWLRARPVNGELAFYLRPELAVDGEELPPPTVAARAKLPAAPARELILLFVPAGETAGGEVYNVAVIDAAERAFPAGTHLLFNLANAQIRGRLGQNGFGLNPGQRQLVGAVKTDHPRGYFEVMLEQRELTAGATAPWERLARAQWKSDKTARRLCLIFDDAARGRIAVRTFNEYLVAITPSEMPLDTRKPPTDGRTKNDPPRVPPR